MKKLFSILIVSAIGLFALATSSQAQTVTSFQFTNVSGGQSWIGTPLTPAEAAGVDRVANWNLVDMPYYSGSTSSTNGFVGTAINSTGSASSIGASITSYGSSSQSTTVMVSDSNNKALLSGGGMTSGTNPVTMTLSGLHDGSTYNFYVYLTGGAYSIMGASLALTGGTTWYFTTGEASSSGTLTSLADDAIFADTWGDHPTPFMSNYVEFTGYTAESTTAVFTLTNLGYINPLGNTTGVVGISGVQVVGNASVPEPSAFMMLMGGVGMLIAGQRLRSGRFRG